MLLIKQQATVTNTQFISKKNMDSFELFLVFKMIILI